MEVDLTQDPATEVTTSVAGSWGYHLPVYTIGYSLCVLKVQIRHEYHSSGNFHVVKY